MNQKLKKQSKKKQNQQGEDKKKQKGEDRFKTHNHWFRFKDVTETMYWILSQESYGMCDPVYAHWRPEELKAGLGGFHNAFEKETEADGALCHHGRERKNDRGPPVG